jgi:hypothetical protein
LYHEKWVWEAPESIVQRADKSNVRVFVVLPCEFYEGTISGLHEPLAILVKHHINATSEAYGMRDVGAHFVLVDFQCTLEHIGDYALFHEKDYQ